MDQVNTFVNATCKAAEEVMNTVEGVESVPNVGPPSARTQQALFLLEKEPWRDIEGVPPCLQGVLKRPENRIKVCFDGADLTPRALQLLPPCVRPLDRAPVLVPDVFHPCLEAPSLRHSPWPPHTA